MWVRRAADRLEDHRRQKRRAPRSREEPGRSRNLGQSTESAARVDGERDAASARAAEDHRLVLCRSEAVYQAVATSGAKLPFGKSGGSPGCFIAAVRSRGSENG